MGSSGVVFTLQAFAPGFLAASLVQLHTEHALGAVIVAVACCVGGEEVRWGGVGRAGGDVQ